MNTIGARIFRNAAALMASQVITWVLALFLAIVTSRYLGPDGLGTFQIANSIWAIAGMVVVFGTDVLLMKEIARRKAPVAALVRSAFVVRTLLFVVVAALIGLYVWAQRLPMAVVVVVLILGVGQLILQYATVFTSTLHGLEMMDRSSVTTVVTKLFYVGAGILVLVLGFGINAFAWTVVAANTVMLLAQGFFLRGHLRSGGGQTAMPMLAMMRAGLPYLFSGLILTAYGQIDVIIMAGLTSTTVVGWYSAALQIYATLLFLPTIVSTAVFPAMARSYADGSDTLGPLMRKSFDLTLLMAVPLGLGLLAVGEPLAVLLFGEPFRPSGAVLSLFGVALILTYMTIILGRFMVSIDRQNSWTLLMGVCAVLTILLDLVLVPWCQQTFGNGALAAAISYIITEGGMVVVGLLMLPKGILRRENAVTAGRIVAAGLLMLLACWMVRDSFVLVPVLVGAAVFIGAALALRAVPADDLALLKGQAGRLAARLQQRISAAPGDGSA